MTQAELERQVARATGETRQFIQQMGFSVLNLPDSYRWNRRPPNVPDCPDETEEVPFDRDNS